MLVPYPAWLVMGASLGLLAKPTLSGRFPLLFRTQQLA
ncbi:MAG: hypothetical protein ACI867_001463, partial [Glaciecola sp.]